MCLPPSVSVHLCSSVSNVPALSLEIYTAPGSGFLLVLPDYAFCLLPAGAVFPDHRSDTLCTDPPRLCLFPAGFVNWLTELITRVLIPVSTRKDNSSRSFFDLPPVVPPAVKN